MFPPGARKKPIELSVVVPVYNEAAVIEESVHLLHGWLDGLARRSELIVVDDGSTDGSPAILARLAADLPAVNLVAYAPNRGRGMALRRGIEAARGAIVVTTEADLSWDTDTLTRLVETIRAGDADVAVASPYCPGGEIHDVPPGREAFSRLSNLVASWVLRHGVTMATGMTRAYRADVLARILSPLDGKAFHLDMLCQAIRQGLTIREVPAVITWSDPSERASRATISSLVAETAIHLRVLGDHLLRSLASIAGRKPS